MGQEPHCHEPQQQPPPQGRAGRRALVSVHAPNLATLGSGQSVPASGPASGAAARAHPPSSRAPALQASLGAGLGARAAARSPPRGGRARSAGSRRGCGRVRSAEPWRPGARRPQSASRALPPPLTRAAGSSPLRRRPRAAEGRGQRQQIGELAWPRSGLRREPPRPGRCAALTPRPSPSEPPAAAPERPAAGPRRPSPVPAAPGAPPWGPGSASGCCCCPPPSCSMRSAAGPLRRVVVLALAAESVTVME